MTVYLIHLDEKISNSQHYIGWTESEKTLSARIAHHKNGSGARFLRAANDMGIEYEVVRTWKDGNKRFERRLKNRKNAKLLCPICNKESWQSRAVDESA